jgi:phage gpG-like protein
VSDGVRQVSGPSFEAIERQLKGIADGRVRQRMVGALAREVRADINKAFNTQTAPSGAAWAPLKRPRIGGGILVRSGVLRRRAATVLLFGSSIRIQMPPYGPYHQEGTRTIPARPFVPTDPLPAATLARSTRAMLEAAARPL